MDYASLVADIPVRLMAENRDWPDELPNVIRKGQERLLEGLHPDALRQSIAGFVELEQIGGGTEPIVTIEGWIDLTGTADFGEITSLQLVIVPGMTRSVLPRAYDFCEALYSTGAPELPKYYAEKTPGWYALYPPPDQAYAYQGIANLRCPLIGPDGPATNLLTDKYATLLEYACCVDGAIWMKDNSAVQIWEAAYNGRLQSVNANIRRRRRDETTVVTRSTENAAGAP